jgi:DNA-binding MarR family transcriptional regulator
VGAKAAITALVGNGDINGGKAMAKQLPDTAALGAMKQKAGVRLSFAAAAVLNRFAEMLKGLGLTPNRLLILSYVLENPGCDQTTLGRIMGINRASAMVVIDKLQAHDLLERRSGANRRTNAIFLTPNGERAFAAAIAAEIAMEEQAFGWMDQASREGFLKVCDELIDRVGRQSDRDLEDAA